MYIRAVEISNIKAINHLKMEFPEGQEAGWHVILGNNGSGKSSVMKCIALGLMESKNALASRIDWNSWLYREESIGYVALLMLLNQQDSFEKMLKPHDYTPKNISLIFIREADGQLVAVADKYIRSDKEWFSVGFGPFRRFSGGNAEVEKLFTNKSYPRLAAHLSILGEDIALSEAIPFLMSLYHEKLELIVAQAPNQVYLLDCIIDFLNNSEILPFGTKILRVDNKGVWFEDANKQVIDILQLSDGFRSLLSLMFELIRQMRIFYGEDVLIQNIDLQNYTINLSGVVLIDEVDAHLHPTWQTRIGQWFTQYFPKLQFIVTTHSPIICRGCADEHGNIKGSIWKLPDPGKDEVFAKLPDEDRDALIFGNILEAFETDVFGEKIERGEAGHYKQKQYRDLMYKKRYGVPFSASEQEMFVQLQRLFQSNVED